MKKNILSWAIALIALFSVSAATAQNVVVKEDPYAVDLGKNLQICIDFAGLGNISQVDIVVHYTATVTTECFNRGKDAGPVPGQTKTFTDQNATLTFRVHNGRARGCQTLTTNFPPGSCPNGFDRGVVADVTFTNISLTIRGRTFNLADPAPVR